MPTGHLAKANAISRSVLFILSGICNEKSLPKSLNCQQDKELTLGMPPSATVQPHQFDEGQNVSVSGSN